MHSGQASLEAAVPRALGSLEGAVLWGHGSLEAAGLRALGSLQDAVHQSLR